MGIKGAHELSLSIKGLSLPDVFVICSYLRQKRDSDSQPTIDLDASLIYRSSKLSIDNRMRQLIDICCQLSAVGFLVVVVCDGTVRHYTKRASIQRQSAYFDQKVKSYLLRVQLMAILEMKNSAADAEEKLRLETEEIFVSTELKSIEKKAAI